MSNATDRDVVTRRLAEIVDELAALPDGPSAERFALLTDRDALRAQARSAAASADDDRSTESLEAELAELTQRRRALVRSRGGYVMGDSADSAGRIGASLTAMKGRTGAPTELNRLNVRISHIEDVLAKRSSEP